MEKEHGLQAYTCAMSYNSFYFCNIEISFAHPIGQLVKNLPAMQETWVLFLGWEDPLEKGMALQYSCLGSPCGQRSLGDCSPWGRKKSDMAE